MDYKALTHELLTNIGPGRMRSTAYDTAWVARLVELDEPIGHQAMEWLREHQLPDGTWGADQPRYFHDRLISTLSAMTALARFGDKCDRECLSRSRLGLDMAIKGLNSDTVGETIGFELLAPTLLKEAKELGVIRRENDNFLNSKTTIYNFKDGTPDDSSIRRTSDDAIDRLMAHREAKIKKLPTGKINRFVTLAFSAEMAGVEHLDLLDIDCLQESNGSVAFSPSATAHFAVYGKRGDPAAINYLRQVANGNGTNGGIPDVAPFGIFERGWALWNLSLLDNLDADILKLCQPHLDFIESGWVPGKGVGFAADYIPKDGDETSVIAEVLLHFGRDVDIETLLAYEERDYFRCFAIEANPSISANIHVLGALRKFGLPSDHPSVVKISEFLQGTRFARSFWFDKWHSSPYYPTSHAIIAANGFFDALTEPAIEWLCQTQRSDGSWGYYGSTAEETAYCLQALMVARRSGKQIRKGVIERGVTWLKDHIDPPYSPLWIGKCLYSPILVVRSAILSALLLDS